MSTIAREFTKEQLQQIIETDHVQCGEASELARIALASLEAEPVCVIDQSNLDYLKSGSDADVWTASRTEMGDVLLYRAAPPAPVSVPAAMEMDDDFDSAFEHGKAVGWNAYRAAMLQAEPVSNSDELPLDYLQGHKDGLEWAAQLAEANHPQTGDWLYDDQIDLARAIRKGPDMPTVQGGSSPVTPDGWISCSERMPEKNQNVLISVNFDSSLVEPLICSARYTGSTFRRGDATIKPGNGIEQATHWMPLPEPPQEVNRG
ncbi:DUF551 domain-containing protein [Escherichia coli]|uniref:DUF551 domain-containing protein n=1 Tax=Escherichia coli TaxID=562 RepID=UPI0018275276|nr:DUF551 domain-containing protein [Escherichia coli]EFH4043269.1 DUF551 domain-containing protein [Escherichia coli]EHI0251552.1 DUF551 domain-containing protein [Escherichia coli]MDF7586002.1 DUF551 domain-containing protein [Escherichia coli]